jgi:hypothetical protein
MGRQRVLLGALAATIALLASGCWTQIGAGPGQRFHNPWEYLLTPDVVDDLDTSWSAPGRALGTIGNSLLLADGRTIRSVSVIDGGQVWSTTLPGTGPGDLVLLTTAVNVGADLWVSWAGTHNGWTRLAASSGAVLAQGTDARLIIGGSDGGLVTSSLSITAPAGTVLDPANGATRFTFTTPVGLLAWPAIGGGRVVTTDDTVGVQGFGLTGCGQPTCAPQWSVDLGPESPLQLAVSEDGASVYVGLTTADVPAVLRLDAATGGVLGRMQLTGGGTETMFAVAGGHVFAVGNDRLEVFDAGCTGTCTPTWSADLPAGAIGPPVVGAGVVHLPGTGGITSFSAAGCGAATCEPLAFLVTGQVAPDLIVANGRLFATQTTGGLFGTSTTTAYAPG